MKKTQAVFLASIFLFFLFFLGCEDEKNKKPFIVIVPNDLEIQAYTNEKIVFTINVLSDYLLTSFVITKKFEGGSESVIFDSTLSTNNLTFQWAYTTPADIDEDLILYFKATNENGEQSVIGKRLIFSGKKFDETTGLKIYSANSGEAAALNLATLQPVALSADSTERDIQEFQADTVNTHLSKIWISPSGCEFVRFNDYDYGNASSSSARDAFQAGIQLSEIANIVIGDVIIVNITRLAPEEVYAVVKITGLIDPDGKNNDFYEISVKK
jgi:hypothetical protein